MSLVPSRAANAARLAFVKDLPVMRDACATSPNQRAPELQWAHHEALIEADRLTNLPPKPERNLAFSREKVLNTRLNAIGPLACARVQA
jgi:hypothetical protein